MQGSRTFLKSVSVPWISHEAPLLRHKPDLEPLLLVGALEAVGDHLLPTGVSYDADDKLFAMHGLACHALCLQLDIGIRQRGMQGKHRY